jgi:hypothetical protein
MPCEGICFLCNVWLGLLESVMKIIPPLSLVTLSDAAPGDLLRRRVFGESFLGIVGRLGDYSPPEVTLGIVALTQSPPSFLPTPSSGGTEAVLSYGKDYAFHVPPAARMRTSFEGGYGAFGALLVTAKRLMVKITSERVGTCFYDIVTGNLTTKNDFRSQFWAVLDWEIRLNSSAADAPPIFSFSAPEVLAG